MDFPLLKSLIAGQSDPLAWLRELVPVDAGQIPRRGIKIALLALGKLDPVIEAVPQFSSDPDFATIRIFDPLTQAVFAGLVTHGALTPDDVSALNALGTIDTPRWQALGLPAEPHSGDISHALSL